jgi:DNA-binding transcriptional LysR family regulator
VLDRVTLDQLRAFVTVVEAGSFSAAARKLGRVQSAISTSMANLETQLEVPLFDRSTKVARLTAEGRAVLGAARRVLTEVDALARLSAGMVMGLEAAVSLCVDALFPLPALIDLCTGFATEFPSVELRAEVQVLSGVSARVLEGAATLGVSGTVGLSAALERRPLAAIRMVPVVSSRHALATHAGTVPRQLLADTVQLVLSERDEGGVPDQAVLSPRTWRVGDLHTKHAMLRAGLGWGNLPEHLVRADVQAGALVVIEPEGWAPDEHVLRLFGVYRPDMQLGPAHQWLLTQLEVLCVRDAAASAPKQKRSRR